MIEPGTLYGIGVGPGDPGLLTVKAARLIREVRVVAAPVVQPDGESYALSIVSDLLHTDHVVLKLHFPMLRDEQTRIEKRSEAARQIAAQLDAGHDVAFLTEGDPLLHSTFGYILGHLPAGYRVEVVPGVTSISAASADLRQPLVNAGERLAVLPAAFEDIAELQSILASFDTVVLLKIHRVLDDLLDLLDDLDIAERAVIVERASHAGGRVIRQVSTLRGQSIHYLSLAIIYSRRLPGDR